MVRLLSEVDKKHGLVIVEPLVEVKSKLLAGDETHA